MESTDDTLSIAMQQEVKTVTFPFSQYVEPGREFGIRLCKTDWVFVLDADERIPLELAEEIKKTITSTSHSFFRIPRKNMFQGKQWLKHGGWWPDHQVRLIQTSSFVSWPKQIHSTPRITGSNGILTKPFEHHFHGNLEQMVQKTLIFEEIESELLFEANKQVKTTTFFRKFFGELFRRVIIHCGFLDGRIGIIEAIYQAFSKTITYLLLYEKKNRRSLHSLS